MSIIRWPALQGVLGIFLREPLADWQREARLLQAGADGEDEYISLKVCANNLPQVRNNSGRGALWGDTCCTLWLRAVGYVQPAGMLTLASDESQPFAVLQVEFAKRRLTGAHPAELTVAELETRHKHKRHWPALQVG